MTNYCLDCINCAPHKKEDGWCEHYERPVFDLYDSCEYFDPIDY